MDMLETIPELTLDERLDRLEADLRQDMETTKGYVEAARETFLKAADRYTAFCRLRSEGK